MTSKKETGICVSRVSDACGIDLHHLECSICHDVLWKPIACQTCETPFCSTCITRWLTNNPNKCPNQCETYVERKCPPFIVKMLAQLQVACFYQSKGCQQIISYEVLEKHEIECGYKSQRCPGCQSEILKKDFDTHTKSCASIQLTCKSCNLVFKRGEAAVKHTNDICLREQLRQTRDEAKENKRVIQGLTHQLNEMRTWMNRMSQEVTIQFDDLPSAEEKSKAIPNIYRGLNWTSLSYLHISYLEKKYPESGYLTAFMPGGSPHIAFFVEEASVSAKSANETFDFVSVTACAAWNDGLQLTITSHRNSKQINTHTATLLFGQPQLILLQWKNIDKVTFKPSGGTEHPGSGGTGLNVIITQLTIGKSN